MKSRPRRSSWVLVSMVLCGGVLTGPAATDQTGALTLEKALEMAERQHPRLAEARALAEAASGRAQEAGRLSNPELILGAQQIPLERGASNQREYSAGVAQSIPLGDRLSKAKQAEVLDREVRQLGVEVARRDLHKSVHSAFATALYQDQAFQAQSRVALNLERTLNATKARVRVGDAVLEDVARVEMDFARTKVELLRSSGMRKHSLLGLKSVIGDPTLEIKSLVGNLDATFEVPELEKLMATLLAQPEARQAEASLRASDARVGLAQAQRIPDVRVEALYHRLEAQKESTLDVGLSIPLSLFNRHQGRLREMRAEAAAAGARLQATQLELSVRIHEAHSLLAMALAGSRSLRTEVLPHADTVLKAAEARYLAGEISLLEILPVRREHALLQLAYLESLRDVMQAWAQVSGYLR